MKIFKSILTVIKNNFGTTAGKICEGNDARLLQQASVVSLEDVNAQLDALQTDGSPDFAGLSLNSSISVTSIEETLAGSSTKLATSYAITSALSGKEPAFAKNTAFNKDFGSSSGTVCEGDDVRLSDSRTPDGNASGDLSGTYPSPTVVKLQGTNISSASPSDGQVLTYDTVNGWQPESPGAGSGYWTKTGTILSPSTAGDIVRVGDGTVSTPSYSWADDPNNGMYRISEDTFGFSAANVNRMTISTAGITVPVLNVTTLNINSFRAAIDGTVGSTSHGWASDTDNGMYRIGTNEFGFSAANVNRMTISSAGVTVPVLNVTTLNIDRLKPTGGTTGLPEFTIPSDPNTGMHLATLDVLELVTAAQARITISGNDISIGMDTADYVGFFGSTPVIRQTELTDELTDNITAITHTAPTTPDYAIQDLTDTGGFGFATKDEGNTVLAQIRELQLQVKNLRTRNVELEDKLVAYGLLPDVD